MQKPLKKYFQLLLIIVTGAIGMSCTSMRDYVITNMIDSWEESDKKILAQQALPENITEIRDVPYIEDGHKGHLLDIYYPDNKEGSFPVIIDIHGGGFFYGYKENTKLFNFHLAKNGFIVFNLNYRLAFNDAKVPDQIQDIISAFNWIEDNFDAYPVDKNKIYVIGDSAGAYLAVMSVLISKNERLQNVFNIGKSNLNIKAMGLISSFIDWTRNDIHYLSLRSMILEEGYKEQEYYQNMILKNIPEINSLPPLFITTNDDDEFDFMTHNFVDILKEKNMDHEFHYLAKNNNKKLGHVFNILHLDWNESHQLNNAMLEYLLQY
jgi:acetyl esterase/lipase